MSLNANNARSTSVITRAQQALDLLQEDKESCNIHDKYFEDKYAAAVNAVLAYEWYKTRPQKLERLNYSGPSGYKR